MKYYYLCTFNKLLQAPEMLLRARYKQEGAGSGEGKEQQKALIKQLCKNFVATYSYYLFLLPIIAT